MAKIKRYKTKKFKISFRTILSILTFVLIIYVVYENWSDITEAIRHLGETNIFVLLLLIPEQLFMYYCCGQMFFFLHGRKRRRPKDFSVDFNARFPRT